MPLPSSYPLTSLYTGMNLLVDPSPTPTPASSLSQCLPQILCLGGQGPSKIKSVYTYQFQVNRSLLESSQLLTHLTWEVGWCWLRLYRANCAQLPSQHPAMPQWQLEVSCDENIYIIGLSTTNRFSFFSLESWLLNIYQHTILVLFRTQGEKYC